MAYLVHRNPRLVFLTLVILTCILIRDIVISVWISSDKALCVGIDAERIEMTSSLNTSFCDAMIDQVRHYTEKNMIYLHLLLYRE